MGTQYIQERDDIPTDEEINILKRGMIPTMDGDDLEETQRHVSRILIHNSKKRD